MIVSPKDAVRIRVQIPVPGTEEGALITDMDTGRYLTATVLDIHMDSDTRQPVMTLAFAEGNPWLDMTGTFRFERIGD